MILGVFLLIVFGLIAGSCALDLVKLWSLRRNRATAIDLCETELLQCGQSDQHLMSDAPFYDQLDSRTASYFRWKRVVDVVLIVLSAPGVGLLMLSLAIWIRLSSGGPILFRQMRVGFLGNEFTMLKFRTMRADADFSSHEDHVRALIECDKPLTKLDVLGSSRLIPGGRFIRALGLDELPQLFNVLRGEMALVGPRPCLPQEYSYFTGVQRERFLAKPGLAGFWQASGHHRTTFSEMVAMDVYYVRHASIVFDIKVILWTVISMLFPSFAYVARIALSDGDTGPDDVAKELALKERINRLFISNLKRGLIQEAAETHPTFEPELEVSGAGSLEDLRHG